VSERIIELIRFMDDYICEKLCINFDTSQCPWTPDGTDNPLIPWVESVELEKKKKWRKACYKFNCKNIGVMKDELKDGGIPCAQKCPVWFICNMFKERIYYTYLDYVRSKEKLAEEYGDGGSSVV